MNQSIPTVEHTDIFVIEVFHKGKWSVFDGIEYTSEEADEKLKDLAEFDTYKFRKRFIKSGYITRLYA